MKVILFLAAVYSLIINQYHQKRTVVVPLPAPVFQARQLPKDSIRRISTVAHWYDGAGSNKQLGANPRLEATPEYSDLSPSW